MENRTFSCPCCGTEVDWNCEKCLFCGENPQEEYIDEISEGIDPYDY